MSRFSNARYDVIMALRSGVTQPPVESSVESTTQDRRLRMGRALTWIVWLYLIFVVATWITLYRGGDQWWLATVLLFGPRWIYALPLVVLLPGVLVARRRLLWPLALAIVLLVGPVMGFCVPWKTLAGTEEPALRVLSWNVQGGFESNEALAALIRSTRPDILAIQECHMDIQPDWPAGWHSHRQGRLLIGTPYPMRSAAYFERRYPPTRWPQPNALCCVIDTPNHGGIGFVNVHLGTPREGLAAVLNRRTLIDPSKSGVLADAIDFRRLESEALDGWISEHSETVVIAGDFNMPADGAIYRRTWSKYANAFSVAGFGFGHTKQTEVLGWSYGSRIDHILAGSGWRPTRCWVGPDLGSDHLPVIADLARDGS